MFLQMAIVYVIVQIIGACIGYGLLTALTPSVFMESRMCMTVPHPSILPAQAFFIEFFLTCTLISVVCSVWDRR